MNAAVLQETDVTTGSTIATLLAHNGPALVDLDETVYLRNSTEDFLDTARPAVPAYLVLRMLDAIRPWRWTGGDATRDVWRVRSIQLLFPWTKRLWEKRVRTLAEHHGNVRLITALQRRVQLNNGQPTLITTLGFDFIVAPLIAALGLTRTRVVAARATTFVDRREGKLRMVAARIGNESIRRALVVTDSKEDEPLLDVCAVPIRIEWPEARFRPAFCDRYLPGQYLAQVKRPGERYIARGILQEDFALWVLASIPLSNAPIGHVFGLLFLCLSFWSIYESGYVDNDRMASRYEHDPKLSGTYGRTRVATPKVLPWIWALASGAIGVTAMRGLNASALVGFGAWALMLGATYGIFLFYNRLDKSTRIWWYALLQLARSAAFVVLAPIQLIGAVAIAAHVVAKWIPYYLYRIGGKNWPEHSHFMPRLLFFVLFGILIAISNGVASILTWSAAALFAWNVYRARHELLEVVFDATRIDKSQGKNPGDPSPIDPRDTARVRKQAP